jgi:hypothetical protein
MTRAVRLLALCVMLVAQGMPPTAAEETIGLCVSAETRTRLHHEMRQLLNALHGIHAALAARDPELLTEHAAAVGSAMTGQVEHHGHGLPSGLPHEFVKLGRVTHAAFDELALLGREGGRPRELLPALSAVTANCVSCHARYRLADEADCTIDE